MSENVLLAVPTSKSSSYIKPFAKQYEKVCCEIGKKTSLSVTLLFAINGDPAENRRVLNALAGLKGKVEYLLIPVLGKNNAINTINQYARNRDYSIVHLLDDDIVVSADSVLRNIETLRVMSGKLRHKHMIVGSRFLPNPKPVEKLGWWQSFWRNVFCLPYGEGCESKAVSGQAMAYWSISVPTLPDKGADDVFLNQWATCREGEFNVFKPYDSIIYFEPAHSPVVWFKQKLRHCVGLIYADMGCEARFATPFHPLSRFRGQLPTFVKQKQLGKAILLKIMLLFIELIARAIVYKGGKIAWFSVPESKRLG